MSRPRTGTMLLLSLPVVTIGIASSLILIMAIKVTSVLQNLLWQRLPGTLGIAQDPLLWIIGVLTLTGIAVGLVIRFSQGHTGPDPACEPLIGTPVLPSALPGFTVALILGLAGGVSLGPEYPIMVVNIALAVFTDTRPLPRVNRVEQTILASAGAVDILLGIPVAATLMFSQTLNGSNEVPLWNRLFASLVATVAGTLTTRLLFHPHSSLFIAYHEQMEVTDIPSGAIVATIIIAAGMVAAWYLPQLHAMIHQMKDSVFVLGIGGLVLGILGAIGEPASLSKGLDEIQRTVADRAFSTNDYLLLAVVKLAALVAAAAGGSHGGRIFPTVFVGVALGLMFHEHVPAIPAVIIVSCAILGTVLMVTRDSWLSLFMAAVVVPNTTLLPLFCIVMLPAWLLLAGKPMMMVNRQKQQPPHDNV